MKLKNNPRIELLYSQDNIIIPCEKGQNEAIQRVLDSVGRIDPNKDYTIEIKVVRKRRSLIANSYYWQLVHQIAEAKGIPYTEYHNRNLAEMGVPKLYDGKRLWGLLPDTDWWMHQLDGEDHYGPTAETEERKGTMYRWFYQLKPSREYDTKEMSSLIDKVVQDAKELNIETMTPTEIERMKQLWGT